MSEAKPDTPEGWRAVLLRWWVLPLAAALLALAYLLLQPQPPRQVVLATGIERSAYVAFGEQYRQALQRHGIDVTLRATQGAADNLALLRQPGSGVDIGFVQGGTDEQDSASAQETDGLVSLGTVFLEPVWLFYRLDTAQQRHGRQTLQHLAELKGWSINIGAAGSGVPPLMQHLLALNRLDASDLLVQQQPVTPAVVDLLEGRVDALVLASAPESSMVQMLLQTPGIGLLDFAQSEAYARRLPYLRPVVLPRGVVDLARNIPAQDIRL
ncbi:MAG: TAXI family TRAP transporter solute-binding subunit, partial [Rubrivivax sp.]